MRINVYLFILLGPLLLSCETLQNTYTQDWRSQLGENEQKEVDNFPKSYPMKKWKGVPTYYTVKEHLDNTLTGPTDDCIREGNGEYTRGPGSLGRELENIDTLTEEEKEELLQDLGPMPDNGGPVDVNLPGVGSDGELAKKVGYYRYSPNDINPDTKKLDPHTFGTASTVWKVKAAGKILAKQGIVMGVGEMSAKGSPARETHGHSEHQTGKDVDLRLIPTSGFGSACDLRDPTCANGDTYDRNKTFTMITTLIDMDPQNVDKILINDEKLRIMINNYTLNEHGIKGEVARPATGHHNHVHFSWH